MSQVIAVVSGKGGTGKTSFTTLTGMALAQLGKKTLLLDCDIGLRNLDLYLGVSDRALMDFTDVIAGRTTLAQAVVRHPLYPNLYLLTAPVSFGVRLPSKREMQRLIDEIRRHFDFCLIDAAAGIGEAFALATCCADRAVVVTTNDPSSLRDAQRTVMELHRFPSGSLHLSSTACGASSYNPSTPRSTTPSTLRVFRCSASFRRTRMSLPFWDADFPSASSIAPARSAPAKTSPAACAANACV